ncbi:MAG: Ig-like domain-containing protein [Methanomassiliicoccales archaeon]|nr:MAG: Ig-like domain-containing protein [Methanomassiliicoccales archaeon]
MRIGKKNSLPIKRMKRVKAVILTMLMIGTAFVSMAGNVGATVFFQDDMESGSGGWTFDGLWHLTESRSHSPEISWAYNNGKNYDTGSRNMGNLTSQVIDLTSATFGNLTFWTWYETQGGTAFDQMWVQISENGGPFIDEYQINPLMMRTWIKIGVNLTSHVGNNIQIRFFFDTIDGDNNEGEGWYIDDVEVNDVPLPPPPTFEPTHSDHGVDTDSDGLFNYLIVNVTVNVSAKGYYRIIGDLSNMSQIESASNYTLLDPGLQDVELRFTGWRINVSLEDGPYTVELDIYDEYWLWYDSDTHTTDSYSWGDFQNPPAFVPSHSDHGLDTDSDTFFNYLVVNVSVNITSAGDYGIIGDLYNQSGTDFITYTKNTTYRDTGIQIVKLYFTGKDIQKSDIDGPYLVELYLDDGEGDLLDTDNYITGTYAYDQFQPPAVRFESPHSDHGLDTDSDMLFDYLVVNVTVNVSEAGEYQVSGELLNSSWDVLDYDSNFTFLETGIQIVELRFKGYKIYNNGENGPYNVTLDLYREEEPPDSDIHETGSYSWAQFQPPPAKFKAPHSDYGLDTNDDTAFNYLVVNVTVNVSIAGDYVILGALFDSNWEDIDFDSNYTYLEAGIQIVELWFVGYKIYNYGHNGTYNVTLSLYSLDEDEERLDQDAHETDFYTWDQFQPPPVTFEPPHSDYGLDLDGDGLFDYLVVNVTVNVTVAGEYQVSGSLSEGEWIDSDSNSTYLHVGIQTVELRFPGWLIRNLGENGPYIIDLDVYDERYSLDSDVHSTKSYTWDEFDTPPAELDPPHSDYGLDMNDDTFYDYLVVGVEVNVSVPGFYTVEGYLDDSSRNLSMESSTMEYLNPGKHVIELGFGGWDIYDNGENGSYTIDLELYDHDNNRLDEDTHTTQSYDYDEFTSILPAWFYPPYSDFGLDLNGDSFDDYLVVNVPVNVTIGGYYAVTARLYNQSDPGNESEIIEISRYINITYLETGTKTVQLYFNGVDINETGIDGPYYVSMELFFKGFGDDWEDLDEDIHTTEFYDSADFASSDTVPPIISSTLPRDGETDVSIVTPIWIVFSEMVNFTSVRDAFSFTDGTETWNSSDGSWEFMANVGAFIPDEPLSYSATYTVTMDSDIAKDLEENYLDGDRDGNAEGSTTDDYVWSFTCGEAPTFDALNVMGTNMAPINVLQGDTNVLMERLTLTAASGTVNVTSIKVTLSGTGSDGDISAVTLYDDTDDSGTLTAGDIQLGTGTFSAGTKTFSGLWITVYPGTPENLLIVFNVSATATVGDTVGCRIGGNSHITVQPPGIVNSFTPIQSINSNIQDLQDTLTVVGNDKAPATVIQGQTDVVMENLTLSADADSITLTAIRIDRTGTGSDIDVVNVKLYDDTDGSGTLTPGDIQLGTTGAFSSDTLTFSGLSFVINSGVPENLLVVFDISATATVGDTVGCVIVDDSYITLQGPDDVNAFALINSTNSSIMGSAPDALTVYGTDCAPTNCIQGQIDVVMEQLTLTAESGSIKVTGIKVNMTGTGTDSDIAAVKLYDDVDDSGTLTVGDVQLGTTQTFSDKNLTFSGLSLIVSSSTSENLLIVFDISGLASSGATVGCALMNDSFITLALPDTVNFFTAINSTNSTIQTDIILPEVVSMEMSDPSPTKAGAVTFTITFSENMNSAVSPAVTLGKTSPYDTYTIVQSLYSENTWTGTFTIDGATGDGEYTVSVSGASDLAGNPMDPNASYTFVIDTAPPTSNASSLPQYQNVSTFDILYSEDDTGSGVSNVELYYRVNGGDWTKYSSTFTSSPISFTASTDGYYEFYTIATDNADNKEAAPAPLVADASVTVDTTKPTVLSIELSDPSPTKAGSMTFTITFSEAMKTGSLPKVTFGAASPFNTYEINKFAYSGNTWTGTFTVDSTTGDGIYTISVSLGEDLVGNQMVVDTSYTFTIDTKAPEVTSITPSGTGVTPPTSISITFNESMNQTAVENSFSLTGGTTTWTAAHGSVSWSGSTMTFTLDSALAYDTEYIITISTDAVDLAGNGLTLPYSSSFTTMPEPDTTAPGISSVSLSGDEVEITKTLTITFDEPMNQTSVEESIFISPDAEIMDFSWEGNTLTITFTSDLEPDTEYSVTIGAGAKDAAGNPLDGPYSWEFTTKAEKPKDDFLANYWWIFLVVVILVIIAFLAMTMLKKRKPELQIPDEEQPLAEEEPLEEPTQDIEEEYQEEVQGEESGDESGKIVD